MIELPEALVLAEQMAQTLRGKQITGVVRGNAPHKFAFYNHTPEEYADLLCGRTLGTAAGSGAFILLGVEPALQLIFGEGGERILLHADARTLPKKHHFLLSFSDGTYLTVTVRGWGFAQLVRRGEFPPPYFEGKNTVLPLSADFSREFFESLFSSLKPADPRSLKYFLISQPGVWGLGNGCLQDILFAARLRPRRPAASLTADERGQLYAAIDAVLRQCVAQGGRDSELDLFGRPGGYVRRMDSRTVGLPCPECAAPIVKEQYQGGAVYFCPHCQS